VVARLVSCRLTVEPLWLISSAIEVAEPTPSKSKFTATIVSSEPQAQSAKVAARPAAVATRVKFMARILMAPPRLVQQSSFQSVSLACPLERLGAGDASGGRVEPFAPHGRASRACAKGERRSNGLTASIFS